MSGEAMRGHWHARVHTVSEDSYERVQLTDMTSPHWIVSFVSRGQVRTWSEGPHRDMLAAHAGDVMIHPPQRAFSEHADVPGTHLWMSLETTGEFDMDVFARFPVPHVVRLTDPDAFRRLFKRLLARWTKPADPIRQFGIEADAMCLIAMILDSWDAQGRPSRAGGSGDTAGTQRFLPIIRYMKEHLSEPVTRSRLATLAHLNANYFDRAFEAAYGVTPMRMLRRFRLERAAELLASTDEPLASIAGACGMGDAANLSKRFAKAFNMTPGQYRARAAAARTGYLR